MSFEIKTYSFQKPPMEKNSTTRLDEHIMGSNWPVVYLLHGNREIYVGETSNAVGRIDQHLDPNGRYHKKRQNLDTVEIVFDTTFNKSAILDIENTLISLLRFEIKQMKGKPKQSKYFGVLQNGNSGQSKMHNYYNRAYYQDEVEKIWKELKERQIATNDYQDIVNDTIFKFSPYTFLNEEQRETCLSILNGIMDALEKTRQGIPTEYSAIVNGVAGTGKTIVLIHLLSKIVEAMYSNRTNIDNDNDDALEYSPISLDVLSEEAKLIDRIRNYVKMYGRLRVAYVAQMTSLRNTVGTVIRELPHVHKKDAKGPFDVVNETLVNGEPFDILLVDEAHRLWQYKKIGASLKNFSNCCKKLYGEDARPEDYTTLDWILKCSRTRVLVYDRFQTVKDSDITPNQFNSALTRQLIKPNHFHLKQQMRCRAGLDFVSYLDKIFKNDPNLKMEDFGNYELYYYDDANKLINDIIIKNVQSGLSKVAAGYGWQWEKPRYDECNKAYHQYINQSGAVDSRAEKVKFYLEHLTVNDGLIEFDGQKYVRNLDFNWILEGDPREIGCIHTSQGYDLNYVGVLFSPEIDYDPYQGIIIYPKKIKDTSSVGNALTGLSAEEKAQREQQLKNYIVNAYKVMMTRGIKGCFVYAHNPGLKQYLAQFFKKR